MRDRQETLAKAILAFNLAFDKDVKFVLVKKEGTSKLHSKCGHILKRAGDSGKCPVCDIIVDIYKNSAENI